MCVFFQTSDFLASLRVSHGASACGARTAPSYEFFDSPSHPDPFWSSAMYGYRRPDKEELRWLVGDSEVTKRWNSAWAYTTLMLHVTNYMRFLTAEVERMGGRFVQGEVHSNISHLRAAMALFNQAHEAPEAQREEDLQRLATAATTAFAASSASASSAASNASGAADAICPPLRPEVVALLRARPFRFVVNCTGLASKWLVPDPGVVGIKGIVFRVGGPGVDVADALTHCYSADEYGAYILPRFDDVTVGGTFGVGDYSTTITPADHERILGRAEVFCKDLEKLRLAEQQKQQQQRSAGSGSSSGGAANAPSYYKAMAGTRPWRREVRLELLGAGVAEPAHAPPSPRVVADPSEDYYSLLDEAAVKRIAEEEAARRARRSPAEQRWEDADADSAAAAGAPKKVPVIHCYGHGGSGITLHMGCAMEVLKLAQSLDDKTNYGLARSANAGTGKAEAHTAAAAPTSKL
jgi:hypothetical protein